MLGAVSNGHEQMQAPSGDQRARRRRRKDDWDWAPAAQDDALIAKIATSRRATSRRLPREVQGAAQEKLEDVKEGPRRCVVNADPPADGNVVRGILKDMESRSSAARSSTASRASTGRHAHVRPISIRPTLLPRVHGSVLFTRARRRRSSRDPRNRPGRAAHRRAAGRVHERFMLHYNFRRTRRARRAASACRSAANRPRQARQARAPRGAALARGVSPTRCASCRDHGVERLVLDGVGVRRVLAMMDAGVPLKSHVAGIAMAHQGGQPLRVLTTSWATRTTRDMDSGRRHRDGRDGPADDIKINGITKEIMKVALRPGARGTHSHPRLMNGRRARPARGALHYAPRVIKIKINPTRSDVIGRRQRHPALTRETGTTIDIRTTAPSPSRACRWSRRGRQAPHQAHHRRRGSRPRLRGAGHPPARLRRDRAAPAARRLLHISQIATSA